MCFGQRTLTYEKDCRYTFYIFRSNGICWLQMEYLWSCSFAAGGCSLHGGQPNPKHPGGGSFLRWGCYGHRDFKAPQYPIIFLMWWTGSHHFTNRAGRKKRFGILSLHLESCCDMSEVWLCRRWFLPPVEFAFVLSGEVISGPICWVMRTLWFTKQKDSDKHCYLKKSLCLLI